VSAGFRPESRKGGDAADRDRPHQIAAERLPTVKAEIADLDRQPKLVEKDKNAC
jgi:hypothetical protein